MPSRPPDFDVSSAPPERIPESAIRFLCLHIELLGDNWIRRLGVQRVRRRSQRRAFWRSKPPSANFLSIKVALVALCCSSNSSTIMSGLARCPWCRTLLGGAHAQNLHLDGFPPKGWQFFVVACPHCDATLSVVPLPVNGQTPARMRASATAEGARPSRSALAANAALWRAFSGYR
jgi:hypothetical protein